MAELKAVWVRDITVASGALELLVVWRADGTPESCSAVDKEGEKNKREGKLLKWAHDVRIGNNVLSLYRHRGEHCTV